MSIWRYSFELVTKEMEMTKKKKQVLENLFNNGKISKATYEQLSAEVNEAINELEGHLKTVIDKMSLRAQELERQISTLELFLASLEIHHAAGDIDDEIYEKQSKAVLLGLEAAKQEMRRIKGFSEESMPKSSTPVDKSNVEFSKNIPEVSHGPSETIGEDIAEEEAPSIRNIEETVQS